MTEQQQHHHHDSKHFVPPQCEYSQKAIRLAEHPENFGTFDDPDGDVELVGTCGESLRVSVKLNGSDVVRDVRFFTEGCLATRACGSAVTILARGKSLDQARSVGPPEVFHFLEGFPGDHHHCIVLATDALQNALKQAVEKRK